MYEVAKLAVLDRTADQSTSLDVRQDVAARGVTEEVMTGRLGHSRALITNDRVER